MKKLVLKDSHSPCNVKLDDSHLTDEVVILEKDGSPVAALVPIAEYEAFQTWRESEARRQTRRTEEAAIEREHAAFEQMLPDLLKKYPGKAVALHNGEVVAVGDDKMDLWAQVRQKLGPVPVYVQMVEYPPNFHVQCCYVLKE